jgi:hypothetical protein
MVLVNATQTLTNKTLDAGSNTITGLVKADVGLGNVDNTSDATKNAASVTLTNKSIDADSNTLSNIENADIKAAAAIAVNKLAAVTVSRVLVSDGSGFISPSSVTATEVGYLSGVTSSIQTQINSALTNPMTTGGDLIYGGASGVPTRLANGTSGQVPMSAGGTSAPTWATLPGNATALRSPTIQKFTATGTLARHTQITVTRSPFSQQLLRARLFTLLAPVRHKPVERSQNPLALVTRQLHFRRLKAWRPTRCQRIHLRCF